MILAWKGEKKRTIGVQKIVSASDFYSAGEQWDGRHAEGMPISPCTKAAEIHMPLTALVLRKKPSGLTKCEGCLGFWY